MELGSNVLVETKGDIMTITIDLSKDFGPSSTGKTIIVASSNGIKACGDVKIGLNVMKDNPNKPETQKRRARK